MIARLQRALGERRRREFYQPTWMSVFLSETMLMKQGIDRAIRRHAGRLTGVVLDYGCGEKPYRDLIPATSYLGVDVAVSGHPDHQKAADLFFDGSRVPLPDASVDGVLATEVFEHILDLPAALADIHRVLRPGGTLLATCPFAWPEHEAPYDAARYTRFGLAHQLTAAGFVVESHEKEVSFVPAVAQLALLYCFTSLRAPRGPLAAILRVLYTTFFNTLGCVGGKLLPKAWDFYLCNVVVARKPESADEQR